MSADSLRAFEFEMIGFYQWLAPDDSPDWSFDDAAITYLDELAFYLTYRGFDQAYVNEQLNAELDECLRYAPR